MSTTSAVQYGLWHLLVLCDFKKIPFLFDLLFFHVEKWGMWTMCLRWFPVLNSLWLWIAYIHMLLKFHIIVWELKGAHTWSAKEAVLGKIQELASSENLLLEEHRSWSTGLQARRLSNPGEYWSLNADVHYGYQKNSHLAVCDEMSGKHNAKMAPGFPLPGIRGPAQSPPLSGVEHVQCFYPADGMITSAIALH